MQRILKYPLLLNELLKVRLIYHCFLVYSGSGDSIGGSGIGVDGKVLVLVVEVVMVFVVVVLVWMVRYWF